MRKKEPQKILLFSVQDAKITRIVDDYIDFVMNPYHVWRQSQEWSDREFLNGFSMGHKPAPAQVEIIPERMPLKQRGAYDSREEMYALQHKPNRQTTEFHFRALIDMIFRLFQSSKSGWFTLNRQILAQIFGNGYPYMITTLSRHDVISGESRFITIPHPDWFDSTEYRYAKSVMPYKARALVLLEQYYKNEEKVSVYASKTASGIMAGEDFLKQYKKNVSLLLFTDSAGLKHFMETSTCFKTQHTRRHYQAFIDKVNLDNGYLPEDKNVVAMGRNENKVSIGRFYHIGTSLPKKLKRFTNLQYGIDAHNSHPLLFNLFLLDYYYTGGSIGIDTNFSSFLKAPVYYKISQFLSSFNSFILYHNVYESLCNYLINNGIIQEDIDIVKTIPIDVLRYIHTSSTGRLWDDIQQRFPTYSRNEIKEYMFQYVFYSYATRTGYYDFKQREYVYLDRKEWVDMFRGCYPSVMKIINAYKKRLHGECQRRSMVGKDGRDMVQLPHLLMRFESVIFTRSLADAFKERIPVIGIHDCLAVIDDTEVINKTQQECLLAILRNHYREFGIVPALSVERY